MLGAVIGLPSFRTDFDNPSAKLEGIIAAIYDLGCFIGAIIAFLTADRYGRKGSITRGCWIMVVGTILQTSAAESVQMIVARIVTGIGNGINTVNVPVWQAESFKTQNRGVSVSSQPVAETLTYEMKGASHHSECAHRLWSSAQHVHGPS